MGEFGRFTVDLLVLAIAATLVKSSYASCLDKPALEDSFYAEASHIGALRWSPPQSCSTVERYELLYTQNWCNTSDTLVKGFNATNETTIFLPSSEVYCVQVRAVINENCYSSYSTCAQLSSLEQGQISVMMYSSVCLPVFICQQQHQSKLILSNTQEQLHLSWSELEMRHNVNRTYDSGTDTFYFCLYNVTESFLFLEYCDINGVPCRSGSTFCCHNWAEFVSRTCVNVAGGRDGGCSNSIVKPLPLAPTFANVTAEYESSGLIRVTSRISIVAPADIVGVDLNGSVFSYNFIYNDGSGSPPTFVVPSASCSDGVCQHVFHIPTSSVPPSYTVSVTATNVFGEGPATTSIPIRTGNSGLQVVVLPSNTVLCLLDGQPAVGCLIRYGNDSSYNNLTNIGRSVATGLTVLTSNLTGDTTYYSVSITTGHLSIELHGSFNTCTIRDLMVINITVQPQSSCSDPTGEVAQACYSGVTPGSTVLYRCATSSFVILFGQSLRTCQSDGIWDGTTPSCVCNASLAIPPHIEGAEVSQLVVSDDSNRATATYSDGETLVFDCDSQPPVWITTSPDLGFGWTVIGVLMAIYIGIFFCICCIFYSICCYNHKESCHCCKESCHCCKESCPHWSKSCYHCYHFCCRLIKKKKNSGEHYTSQQSGPDYDEPIPQTTMMKNPAYESHVMYSEV